RRAALRRGGRAGSGAAPAELPRSVAIGTIVSPRGVTMTTCGGATIRGGRRAESSAPRPHVTGQLPLLGSTLQVLALVVQLLRLGERDRHLGDAVLEIQLERHDGESLAAGAADQLADLVSVEQQFAGAGGRRVVVAARQV